MKKPAILVIGSINMDLVLQMDRVPQPGESMIGRDYSFIPGGKGANQAVGAARLGAKVTFVGRIGRDAHGEKLAQGLAQEGISTTYLAQDSKTPTGLAVIMLESTGQNRIAVYPSANMKLSKQDLQPAFEADYDAMIMQLEMPDEVVVAAHALARQKGIPVVLDTGPAREFDVTKVPELEILTPNETETTCLTGLSCSTLAEAEKAAAVLAEKSQAKYVVIKMGANGALLYHGGQAKHFDAFKIEPKDTTAAGDASTTAMVWSYIKEPDISKAIACGNAAGAITATRLGAQPSLPTQAELREFMQAHSMELPG